MLQRGYPVACKNVIMRLLRVVVLLITVCFAVSSLPAEAQTPILRPVTYHQVTEVDHHSLSCRCASCNPAKCCCVKVKSPEPAFRPLCALIDTELRVNISRSIAWTPAAMLGIPAYFSDSASISLWRAAPQMMTKWSAPPPAQPPQA